jgi:hypothetical protein
MPQQAVWPRASAARAVVPPAVTAERYQRAESSSLTTLGDTNATVITFSGRPDAVQLSAQAFGAIFVLDDLVNRTLTELHIPAGASETIRVNPKIVRARNAVAGSNAIVMAVGLWAERGEAANGNP